MTIVITGCDLRCVPITPTTLRVIAGMYPHLRIIRGEDRLDFVGIPAYIGFASSGIDGDEATPRCGAQSHTYKTNI